jgi:DNA-directed RNA polymerase-5 subunit 1
LSEQAVPGKEPLKKDRNGRFAKQDDHRWTKDWLTQNILGKGGNYTARAVIVGDPSLGIEEIGVPWEIAQKLTIPERAVQWNCTKLQEYVDTTQMLQGSGKPGATRIERNGEAFQVWANSTHKVYVNRPPSVHKHSLMAFKVRVHYGLILTINPLVCPPFNADFDGDIFHVFIPQSLQAIAELEQLMTVSQQIVSDHGGQPLLGLTQVIFHCSTGLATILIVSGVVSIMFVMNAVLTLF